MNLVSSVFLDLGVAFTQTDLIYSLVACGLAISIGVLLAKKQARTFSGQSSGDAEITTNAATDLPHVNFFEYGDMRFLHLSTPAVQGSMQVSKPFDIHLEYVQRMMGWLLFVDLDMVSQLQAMQLGLGAASLTKFCHKHLDMKTTAVELNPHVVATCRLWFNLPEDNAKLQVIVGDAADIAGQESWQGKIDALQVDLYDQDANCPVLDSEVFYADCRRLLTENGCMTVNLFGRNASIASSIQKIGNVFGKDALWAFKPTQAGNTILLALRTPRLRDANTLLTQAQAIQARWPLHATKWLKVLAPLQ
jgi:spermidine synthase